LPRVLPLPADPPGAVQGVPAPLGRQLGPAGGVGRWLDGAARPRRDDVAGRPVGRPVAARRRPAYGALSGTLPEPADLGAPRLRDGPPDAADRAGAYLGGVLVVFRGGRDR